MESLVGALGIAYLTPTAEAGRFVRRPGDGLRGYALINGADGRIALSLWLENGRPLHDRTGRDGFYYEAWLGDLSVGPFNADALGHGCLTTTLGLATEKQVWPTGAPPSMTALSEQFKGGLPANLPVKVTAEPFGGTPAGGIPVLTGSIVWLGAAQSFGTGTATEEALSLSGAPDLPVEDPADPSPVSYQPWATALAAPELATPEGPTPELATPWPAAPWPSAPWPSAPWLATPERAAPERAAPERAAPWLATPRLDAPELATPQQAPPQQTTPQQATPQLATPQQATPQLATPQQATTQPATQERATPKVAVPEVAVPEVVTPEAAHEPAVAAAEVGASGVTGGTAEATPPTDPKPTPDREEQLAALLDQNLTITRRPLIRPAASTAQNLSPTFRVKSLHPLAPRVHASGTLDGERGALTIQVRSLPSPSALGKDEVTGRPWSAYRAWLTHSQTGASMALGLLTRGLVDQWRFEVPEGLPLARFDTLLVCLDDRTNPEPKPAPIVLQGSLLA